MYFIILMWLRGQLYIKSVAKVSKAGLVVSHRVPEQPIPLLYLFVNDLEEDTKNNSDQMCLRRNWGWGSKYSTW